MADHINTTVEQHRDDSGYRIQSEFLSFLHNFELSQDDPNYQAYIEGIENQGPVKYYQYQAEQMKSDEKVTLFIDFLHLLQFRFQDTQFITNIVNQYHRYEVYLRKAVAQFMADLGYQPNHKTKFFQIGYYNLPQINKIRDLKVMALGRLMAIHGTVTRTTEVKPELLMGLFKCKDCGTASQHVEQQFKFTEPVRCQNEKCMNRSNWEVLHSDSVFLDWQKLRVQEHSGDIPAGSMPRSIDVILRGEIVDKAKPGDRTIFTGNLVVVPDIVQLLKPGEKPTTSSANTAKMKRNDARTMDGVTGLKRLGVKDLSYKLVFIANSVHAADSRFGFSNVNSAEDEEKQDALKQFTIQEQHQVMGMKDQDDLYMKLSRSIAPSVYGHQDVKKGILLQLFGGVHKSTTEGIKLRGDINICIVGDPSTSKSQFLKYICSFLPRSIYTSGKASSAAGLTASVLKDPETGEFCIEAGALMLADHGVCCIDEFDKMDAKDQVAIHEAMEQQTISIAKAGIHATLNARSSILAAANPINGRYDRSRSLRFNVDISAPIMSRFDLFFVIFDEKRDDEDFLIAQHIVNMHRLKEDSLHPDFSTEQLQTYIKFCRTIKPKFNQESAGMLKEEFKRMRQNEKNAQRSSYKITVRQLESLIRLSEAMARAHCDHEIKANYVREVCRLMRNSNINIIKGDIEFNEIQEEINKERQLQRQMTGQQDQMQFDVIQDQADQVQQEKKVKISFEEYQKLAFMIITVLKEFERNGEDNVRQGDVVEKMVHKIELEGTERGTSEQQAIETTKKIGNVINYLINNENIIMISQDAKAKADRYLTLNVNCDLENIAGFLQGSKEAIF